MIIKGQIILVMLLWALCFPLITLGLDNSPHLTFAALRAFVAGGTLLIIAFVMKRPQPRGFRPWLIIVAIGFGATTLGFFGMFHAAEFVSPGVATVIANTQPLMAAIVAALVLKEHLVSKGKIGLIIGFLGIVFIAMPALFFNTDGESALGILYITIAALGITISNILIRLISNDLDPLSAMGWQLVIGSIFLALIAAMTENISITWNSNFLLSLFGLALPGTAYAYWLWFRILKNVELNIANSYSFLVPIFGLSIGAIFYDEQIEIATALGIGLIIFGIILVNWPPQKKKTCNSGLP